MEQKKIEINTYLQSKNFGFVQSMMVDVLKVKPSNPVDFCLKWLQKYQEQKKIIQESQDDGSDAQEIIKEKKKKLLSQGKKRSRLGISQQVFGQFNKKHTFIHKQVPKSEQSRILILSLIKNSILFQNIGDIDKNLIIDAMQQQLTSKNQTIIQQGDSGNLLYIVQSGQYDCYKIINGKQTYLKTYKFGQSFGQLALMYNSPRAATIKVKTSGRLFTLDRKTFSQLLKDSNIKKRQFYQNILEKVQLFSQLNPYQKQQFCDVLRQQKYQSGQYIIKQGDKGDKFYIVISGKLVAQKLLNDNTNQVVYNYKQGDYFGELSLIHDINRQASVKALTQVKLVSIDRESLMRVLGSLKDILNRNQKRYQKFENELVY